MSNRFVWEEGDIHTIPDGDTNQHVLDQEAQITGLTNLLKQKMEEQETADKLLRQWMEWFSMNPGKLQMAPSAMTRLHLSKSKVSR